MLHFYNKLYVQTNKLTVLQNATVDLIKRNFLFALVPMCIFFSGVLIHFAQTPLKYLSIPASILLVIYYKMTYMKVAENEQKKFLVDSSQIVYRTEFDEYIIPLTSVCAVEDKSTFYDFPGRGNRGWNHLFVLRINSDACIKKRHGSEDYRSLSQSPNKNVDLEIGDLHLKHTSHLRLLNFINDHIG